MKLATSTGDFKRYCKNEFECVKEIHDAGFKNVDLNLYTLNESSPLMQDDWRDYAVRLKDYADSLGMKFVQAHSQCGNAFSNKESEVDFILKSTKRSIEVCSVLGIKNTVAHSGYYKDLTKDEWFERNKKYYENYIPLLEECGVNLLCENNAYSNTRNDYFINTAKDMLEFIKFVDHPLFHGCWDTGHANCNGSQYDEILTLGDEIYAIHYNDNHGAKDDHVAPFLGRMNHDEVINALIDVGYKGYLTFECGASLIPNRHWLGNRREFNKEGKKNLLSEPQLFMQRHIEKMLYETGKWMLESYGIFEE